MNATSPANQWKSSQPTVKVHPSSPAPEPLLELDLAGSGWKEYQQHQTVCGIPLPRGLVESSELPEPIFTPATKAATGHDINISFDQAAQTLGADTAAQVRRVSLQIYNTAREFAR